MMDMIQRKMKATLISGIVILSFVTGLFFPKYIVEAQDDTDEEQGTETTSIMLDDGTDTPLGQLIAYWPFDGNYNETVSKMDTKLGGKQLTYTNGVFGKAVVFNGKNTYLTVKNTLLNLGNNRYDNNDNFTISAWVNLGDCKQNDQYLLDKGMDASWDKDDQCYWTDPYKVLFTNNEPIVYLSNDFEHDGEDPYYRTEGSSRTGGKYVEGQEWFLLTVTYDGNRVKIYRDNELLTQNNYTNGITFNNDDLYIGVNGGLEYFFKGSVDDLRIYTKTLSYDDINELYQKGVSSNKELVEPTKQLVAYYPFDDNLKDSSTFKNDAEKVAVGGTTKYIVGMNGKAVTMSKGNYIRVPAGEQLNPETEFTVSFWLKVNTEKEVPILYRQNPSNVDDNDNDWTYRAYINSWEKGTFTSVSMNTTVYDSSSNVPESGAGLQTDYNYDDSKLKSNNWNHYTYTYQDGQMKFYLNGILLNKSDKSDLINISNASGDLLIGYDGDTFMNGAIDELKIYTKCLSATDVEKEVKRIDSISLSSSNVNSIASIGKGKTVSITSVILMDGDTGNKTELKVTDKEITYQSSSKKVFTVSKDGKLTGVKAGKAKLTVAYGPHTAAYSVVVK
jgi:hypothetical protein